MKLLESMNVGELASAVMAEFRRRKMSAVIFGVGPDGTSVYSVCAPEKFGNLTASQGLKVFAHAAELAEMGKPFEVMVEGEAVN